MKRDELLYRALNAIVLLNGDDDQICSLIHAGGGCDWCEKNCGKKGSPDVTCARAWIENYYDEALVKMLVGKD